jgi:hypothetical protein
MYRLMLLVGLAASGLVLASFAAAAPSTHTTRTFNYTDAFPAGTFCDFNYHDAVAETDDITTFSNGRVEIHITEQVTHTNVDTSYTLTDADHFSVTLNGEKVKIVGLLWHLRDANGKIVVVHAGEVLYGSSGLIKFTPNSGPDAAAVLCPALGGNPA